MGAPDSCQASTLNPSRAWNCSQDAGCPIRGQPDRSPALPWSALAPPLASIARLFRHDISIRSRLRPPVVNLREVFSGAALVIVAAGRGTRFGGFKQLTPIGGESLLKRTMSAFDELPFAQRIVVLPRELHANAALLRDLSGARYMWKFVEGGDERVDSVKAGIAAMDSKLEFVAVHDGARPFPPLEATWRCMAELAAQPILAGAIVAAPVTDTLKRVDKRGGIVETIPRGEVRRAETPQIVRRDLILDAFARTHAEPPTDEAQALERAGHLVVAFTHDEINLKITTTNDIAIAEALLNRRPNLMRPEIETR